MARTLIAASRSDLVGAHVFNLGGSLATLDEFIATVEGAVGGTPGLVTAEGDPLPFPDEIDPTGIESLGPVAVTPLASAVRETVEIFRDGLARGVLDPVANGLEPVATPS